MGEKVSEPELKRARGDQGSDCGVGFIFLVDFGSEIESKYL